MSAQRLTLIVFQVVHELVSYTPKLSHSRMLKGGSEREVKLSLAAACFALLPITASAPKRVTVAVRLPEPWGAQ